MKESRDALNALNNLISENSMSLNNKSNSELEAKHEGDLGGENIDDGQILSLNKKVADIDITEDLDSQAENPAAEQQQEDTLSEFSIEKLLETELEIDENLQVPQESDIAEQALTVEQGQNEQAEEWEKVVKTELADFANHNVANNAADLEADKLTRNVNLDEDFGISENVSSSAKLSYDYSKDINNDPLAETNDYQPDESASEVEAFEDMVGSLDQIKDELHDLDSKAKEELAANSELISAVAKSSAEDALAELRAELAKKQETKLATASPLEGFIADMIKPMLKEWLDQNLPAIVRKVVQKEISKLTQD